jgi:ribosomal subunit interface protein
MKTFPTITYKLHDTQQADQLKTLVEQKFASLAKYWDEVATVTCEVEFEKVAPRQHGAVHRVEVNLVVDGSLYRAEATEESFENAIDEVQDGLDHELRRAKEKNDTLIKKGGREMKDQLLGL